MEEIADDRYRPRKPEESCFERQSTTEIKSVSYRRSGTNLPLACIEPETLSDFGAVKEQLPPFEVRPGTFSGFRQFLF